MIYVELALACSNYTYTDQLLAPNYINTVSLERVSPKLIYLCLPEKLVIEVKATGRYLNILWQKNGAPLTVQSEQFPNFNEILVIDVTSSDDLGLYEVNLRPVNIQQQVQPSDLDFFVVPPGKCHGVRSTQRRRSVQIEFIEK